MIIKLISYLHKNALYNLYEYKLGLIVEKLRIFKNQIGLFWF